MGFKVAYRDGRGEEVVKLEDATSFDEDNHYTKFFRENKVGHQKVIFAIPTDRVVTIERTGSDGKE